MCIFYMQNKLPGWNDFGDRMKDSGNPILIIEYSSEYLWEQYDSLPLAFKSVHSGVYDKKGVEIAIDQIMDLVGIASISELTRYDLMSITLARSDTIANSHMK